MKIGFVGLGSMGGDQARQLVKKFDAVRVYDVSPKAMAVFEKTALLASSVADAASDTDVVGLCVRDDAQVNQCADALVPIMKAGSVLLVHSTVQPATVISIAKRAAEKGVTVLDAPVTRTETGNDRPFVFCMTGGDEVAARRVRPVIDAYATDTLHVGPLGSAMALKISNNLVSWVEILVGLEAFRIAEAAGVPTESLLKVMQRNGCLSPPMKAFIEARGKAGDAEFRDFMTSQAGIGQKDLNLAAGLGRGLGVPNSIATYAGASVYGAITDVFRKPS
jgi:3-hydroxyisobutyrate dehydrogenase